MSLPKFSGLKQTVTGLPRIFWYLWVGTLINRVGIFVLPFLTLFLTRQRGVSIQEATFVVSLYGLGSFASQLIGGYMTDLWGRRSTMLVSLFVTPVVLMVLSSLTNFFAIGVTTLLLGLFTDLYRPASGAIIADAVPPEDRARAFSLRYWAINLGAAIGLSLAGWLATHNYLLLFIGDAATTFAFGVVTLMFIPETRVHHPTSPASASASRRLRVVTHLRSQFAEEAKLIQFGLLFAALMLITASVYNQADATMPLAMQANHLNESDFGTVIALNGVVIVLVSLTVNRLLEKRSAFLIMAAGALLIGSGFGMYAFATTKLAYAFGVVIWTLGEVAGAPIAPTILADLAPVHRRGFYQSLIGASFGLAAFTGPIIGGFIYSNFGSTTLWVVCFIAGLIAALGHIIVIRPMYARLRGAQAESQLVASQLVGDAVGEAYTEEIG